MNNRLWNAKNPYQGEAEKVLCLCSAGLLRSPTLAWILSNEPFNYNTRAAGVDVGHALIPIDDVLVHWADKIVCVNMEVAEEFRTKYDREEDLYVLDIPDAFAYRDERLIEIARQQLHDTLKEVAGIE